MVKKTASKKVVSKVVPKKETEFFEELGVEDLADEGITIEKPVLASNEYFEVYAEGKPEVFQRVNLEERLRLIWQKGKDVPRNLWRKIRFNIPTANPMAEILPYAELLAKMKADKNSLILHDASIVGRIGKQIWDKGTIIRVPPEVAKEYTSTYYDMGYEGLGDVTNVQFEDISIKRKMLHVATYVDNLGE